MTTFSITSIKSSTVTPGGDVELVADAKYVGEITLSFSRSSAERLTALGRPASAPAAVRSDPVGAPETKAAPNKVPVIYPQKFAVSADLRKDGMVLVLFETQAEGSRAYAVDEAGARFAAEHLVQQADVVMAHKAKKAAP